MVAACERDQEIKFQPRNYDTIQVFRCSCYVTITAAFFQLYGCLFGRRCERLGKKKEKAESICGTGEMGMPHWHVHTIRMITRWSNDEKCAGLLLNVRLLFLSYGADRALFSGGLGQFAVFVFLSNTAAVPFPIRRRFGIFT